MEVLVDVNVIITFITQRDDPYKEECDQIIKKCSDGTINGYIAFHSLSIIWYVLRRKVNDTIARKWLKDITSIFTVACASQEQINIAIDNVDFKDFEDCLQDRCAVTVNADYIVTSNLKDYVNADTPTVTPDVLLDIIKNNSIDG